MESNDLVKLLEKRIFITRGSMIHKLIKAPYKMLSMKILEKVALMSRSSLKIRSRLFWCNYMTIVIPEDVSLKIYRYGFYEEGLTKMFICFIKPGMTFFDIGAHYGYFTLLGSILVGKGGLVYSFEPTKSTFDILKANVKNKGNVCLNNLAVYSENKIISMNDYGIKYCAFNSIYKSRLPISLVSKIKSSKYKVKAITVDKYIENENIIPDFIKIDAESAEYNILLGMEKTIWKFHPIISLEVGDRGVKGIPTSREIVDFLIKWEYQPYEFKDNKILKHNPQDNYQYDNLVFLPLS